MTVQCDQAPVGTQMLVLEATRQPSVTIKTPRVPEKSKPCPHDFPPDKLMCSVVQINPSSVLDDTRVSRKRKRVRGRRKHEVVSRPQAAFWRPLRAWQGKSAGYAYGYSSSKPVDFYGTRARHYRRDTMRKGVLVA